MKQVGIDISGGMIVGAFAPNIEWSEEEFDSLYDFVEEHDLDHYSSYYDCEIDECIIGFKMKDVLISELDDWLIELSQKSDKFETICGCKPTLYGMQNVR